MRMPALLMIVTFLVAIAIDVYIYIAARRRCRSRVPAIIQLVTAMSLYAMLVVAVCLPFRGGSDAVLKAVMWLVFTFFSALVSKALFVIFDLLASLPRIFGRRRISWISVAGGIVALAAFLFIWWGALVNRFRMQVRHVEIDIPELPVAFDGLRIVQFSDLHTGTYGTDTTYVSRVVERINSLDPDLIVFTGDIVNRHTDELAPFVGPLSRLDAPMGVYSIMGNHDYGDYSDWPSEQAKEQNLRQLHAMQAAMGWHLLLNDHKMLRIGADSVALIGVENVGDPPFRCYGSLERSYPTLSDSVTKLLLSHNPAHWTGDIAANDSIRVALTLSGHTHAMQMEVADISPAVLRYPTWGGLYSDPQAAHQLYVNIGMGTVGMPMRLGATPEITLITLRRGDVTPRRIYSKTNRNKK